jgi:predicted DNA-binding ribbon-helix-helix protein
VLKEIAIARGLTLSGFTTSIEEERQHGHLSSCLRLFVLDYYRNMREEELSRRFALPDKRAMSPAKSA